MGLGEACKRLVCGLSGGLVPVAEGSMLTCCR